jgi:hypothetical protein
MADTFVHIYLDAASFMLVTQSVNAMPPRAEYANEDTRPKRASKPLPSLSHLTE